MLLFDMDNMFNSQNVQNIYSVEFANEKQIDDRYIKLVFQNFKEAGAFDLKIINKKCIALIENLNFSKINGVTYKLHRTIFNEMTNKTFYEIHADLSSLDFLYAKMSMILNDNFKKQIKCVKKDNKILLTTTLSEKIIQNSIAPSTIRLHLLGANGNILLKNFDNPMEPEVYSLSVLLDNETDRFVDTILTFKSGEKQVIIMKILPSALGKLNEFRTNYEYKRIAFEINGVVYFSTILSQLVSTLQLRQEFRLCECSKTIATEILQSIKPSVPAFNLILINSEKKSSKIWEIIYMLFFIALAFFLSRRKLEQLILFLCLSVFYKFNYDHTYLIFLIHAISTFTNRFYAFLSLFSLYGLLEIIGFMGLLDIAYMKPMVLSSILINCFLTIIY